MIISAQTKIAQLIREDRRALEAIISLSPKFEKLRNPLLRKMIAGRTSIGMACSIGGCTLQEFFDKMRTLAFTIDEAVPIREEGTQQKPAFMFERDEEKVVVLDVRPYIEKGRDPLQIILKKIGEVKPGGIFKIINTFAPTPLIKVLGKKGFESYIEQINSDLYEGYFFLPAEEPAFPVGEQLPERGNADWHALNEKFAYKLVTIDVRELEMPMPMHKILETLETMNDSQALYVYHKRIPVFLIPELKERGYDLRVQTISEQEVHLLIFKAS